MRKHTYIPAEHINLSIQLPSSKSISNRALIINALSYSPYDILNLSDSDDTQVLKNALDSNDTNFDIGAAGTAMRFLTAFLAKTVGEWTITGSERMKQRPIKILVEALNSLGAKIEYMDKEGFPPLRIFGSALTGGTIQMNGNVSSQYISALMMIAPYMQEGLRVELQEKIISQPYIRMTQGMMRDFGVLVDFTDNIINIPPQTYKPTSYSVESDWSAASYWYEIVSLVDSGEVFLLGLRQDSYQGDSKVAELFEQLGVATSYQKEGVRLRKVPVTSVYFEYNFTNEPDLAQTFAVTCCLKNVPFFFSGLESLKIKETNRVLALITELRKLGYVLTEKEEGTLQWDGTRCEADAEISIATYEDHRMAMAFAPAALSSEIDIENPEVVSKSYPKFWSDFALLSS